MVAGDSAGAGLATGLALATGIALAGLLLISPWLDVTMTNPAIRALEDRDVMLGVPGLRYWGRAWAGEWALDDPRVSPIHGDLGTLPPTRIYQGGRDVFLADARRCAVLAEKAGGDVALEEFPDGFHVFPGATFTPEAHRVFADMGRATRRWSRR